MLQHPEEFVAEVQALAQRVLFFAHDRAAAPQACPEAKSKQAKPAASRVGTRSFARATARSQPGPRPPKAAG